MAHKVVDQVQALGIVAEVYAQQIQDYGQRVLPDTPEACDRLAGALVRLRFIQEAREVQEHAKTMRECMD